jgi:nucleotide-binding universal stress UspA family protein
VIVIELGICAMTFLHEQLRILLASDLTARAAPAFERAVELTASNNAHLRILHVIRDDLLKDVGDIVHGAAHEALQQQETNARSSGATDAQMKLVLAGHYDDAIIDESRQHRAHFIVLGSPRARPLRDAVLGATMERVLRFGDRPVLVVKTSPKGPYNNILAAVDFSVPSRHALEFAIRLFPHGHFHVLNVCPSMLGDTPQAWVLSPEAIATRHEAQLKEMIEAISRSMKAELPRADFTLTPIIDHGHPVEAAKAQIERLRPDLVVVGTHGHTGWRHSLAGSVAAAFLASMPCDVLAVRPLPEERSAELRGWMMLRCYQPWREIPLG